MRGGPSILVQECDATDRELLRALAQPFGADGRAALTELYHRHAHAVRGLLGRFSGVDAATVEDCVQETFLRAQAEAARFESGSARPWLLTIAMHQVRERRRSDARRKFREARALRERPREVSQRSPVDLDELLECLPERDRVLLELRFVQDLGFREVAAALGVSIRTAKSWSALALERLRERFKAKPAPEEQTPLAPPTRKVNA